MRRIVPAVLDAVTIVALAVWLGGLAVCWLMAAPAVHSVPVIAVPGAEKLLFETLRQLGGAIEVCGLVIAAVQWVLRRRYQRDRSLFIADGIRMLIVFIALFSAEYGRYVLLPTLLRAYVPAAYQTLEGMALAQAGLLVAFAAVTVWMQQPRPASVPSAPLKSPTNPALQPTKPTPTPQPMPSRKSRR